jgi:hypothetical protein
MANKRKKNIKKPKTIVKKPVPPKTKKTTEVINTRQQNNTVNASDSDHYIIPSDNDSDYQDDRPTRIHSSPLPDFRTNITQSEHAIDHLTASLENNEYETQPTNAHLKTQIQSMMQPMMQSMLQPMMQPMLQYVMQPIVKSPESKKTETRGRKPKPIKEILEHKIIEVCSIKWVCDANHPNFSLNNKIDTCQLEKITGYGRTFLKTDVSFLLK